MKVYVINHGFGWYHEGDCNELIAAYKTEDNAKLHLKTIYDKLVQYKSDGRCEYVRFSENEVVCEPMLSPDYHVAYDYGRWTVEEVDVYDTLDQSKIEPYDDSD